MESSRGKRKTRQGVVLSDKMDKTIVVRIERKILHPIYKKVIIIRRNYKAHDAQNKAATGDTVEIMETRPISKDKRWRLVNILSKSIKADKTSEQDAVEKSD